MGPSGFTGSWAWATHPSHGHALGSRCQCGFQFCVQLAWKCLGIPLSPVLSYVWNFGEDWRGGGHCCVSLKGPCSWGQGLPFNHWVPGPKTCSGMELGKGFFLLRGLSSAFICRLCTWSGTLLGASWG